MTDEEKIEGKNETDAAATVGHGGYGVEKDSFYKTEPTKQQKFAKMVLYTFLSSLVYSLAFHYFVTPCMFAPGGIGGLVAMLKFAIGKYVPSGIGFDYTPFVITFLNVPVLILAYKGLSKEFAINTAFTVIFMTAIMLITDNLIDPSYTISITG
ncbi:MAG: YitT family protein, partial [Clostridia bacterium]|nr:YitT family protein [Clostridia bacterium]